MVSEEVRELSKRTSDGTNEIQSVTNRLQKLSREAESVFAESVSMAERSVAKASQTGASLTSIYEGIHAILEMNSSIASIADQQNGMTTTISRSIDDVSRAVANSADHAGEIVESCRHLAGLAGRLSELVGRFRA